MRLRKIIKGPDTNVLKRKAASKIVVSELKEELEAQGLPTDGTRNVLYQRVQKARTPAPYVGGLHSSASNASPF
ncbi:hypothetical protein ACFX19_010764 [Malus domestica]